MEGRRGSHGRVPGAELVMHVPRKKKDKSKRHDRDDYDDDLLVEIDPQLRYSFQRNYHVSIFLIFIFVSWFCLLREFLISCFKLCFFGYPILSFLITCFKLCFFVGFLVVLNCVLIDSSYVSYERFLICLRINWECELLPVGQCVATL